MKIEEAIELLEDKLDYFRKNKDKGIILDIPIQAIETLIKEFYNQIDLYVKLDISNRELKAKYNKAVNYMAIKEDKDFEEIDKMLGEE